jgi:hypothetical protein
MLFDGTCSETAIAGMWLTEAVRLPENPDQSLPAL